MIQDLDLYLYFDIILIHNLDINLYLNLNSTLPWIWPQQILEFTLTHDYNLDLKLDLYPELDLKLTLIFYLDLDLNLNITLDLNLSINSIDLGLRYCGFSCTPGCSGENISPRIVGFPSPWGNIFRFIFLNLNSNLDNKYKILKKLGFVKIA